MKKNFLVILLLAVLVTLMSLIFTPGKGEGDFLAYWSAARLMITWQNPYDMESLQAIQITNRRLGIGVQEITLGPGNPS